MSGMVFGYNQAQIQQELRTADKPHIAKLFGIWQCTKRGYVWGTGSNPKAAYDDWLRKLA